VGPAVGLVAPEAGRRIDNLQRSFAAGVAAHAGETLRGAGELLQHDADNPLDMLAPGLSRALGVNSVSGGLPVGRPLQLLGQAVSAIPGVITDPALAQNGEAKAGRFAGGLGAMLFQAYVAPETLVPTLFAQGYAGQYEAAQRQFGGNMTPEQEATAHLAGILGGGINAALGVPFSTYGKAVASFFGAADFGVVRAALDNAAASGGAPGLANILSRLKDAVQAQAGADTAAADATLLPRAVQGLQGVIDTLRTPAFQRAGVIASRGLRDAALGAATQFGQNAVARTYNPQQGLMTGVGASATQFALLGGLFGAIAPTGVPKENPAGTATGSASTSAKDNPSPGANPRATQVIPSTIPGLDDSSNASASPSSSSTQSNESSGAGSDIAANAGGQRAAGETEQPVPDELLPLVPGARQRIDAIAKTFADSFAKHGVNLVDGPQGKFRVNPDADGNLSGEFDWDWLARRVINATGGNSQAVDTMIHQILDEEVTHGAWMNDLRQRWLAEGGQGQFDHYVFDHREELANNVIDHVERLPEPQRTQAIGDISTLVRLYDNYSTLPDAVVWNQLKTLPKVRQTFAGEAVRQLSQMERLGETAETGYLASQNRAVHFYLNNQLHGILGRAENGLLGPMLIQDVAATHAAIYRPEQKAE